MGHSLLYVEPLYLQAESGQIPELKRVILASGEKVVMTETLGEGLVSLFGARAGSAAAGAQAQPQPAQPQPAAPGVTTGQLSPAVAQQVYDLAQQADQHYTAAQAALRAGDWATYGKEQQAMEDAIKKLVEITGPQAK
jgi:uncharacterized membrane protein (UPF0182 family)